VKSVEDGEKKVNGGSLREGDGVRGGRWRGIGGGRPARESSGGFVVVALKGAAVLFVEKGPVEFCRKCWFPRGLWNEEKGCVRIPGGFPMF